MHNRLIQELRRAVMVVLLLALAGMVGGCAMTNWLCVYPRLPSGAVKRVVAVSSFENRSGFDGQWQLGSGMADLLVSELVRSENFDVVERQHFETVVGEIHRQQNGLFRPEGKTTPGRMKSAQYLIRGVINDFSQTGGGSLAVALRTLLFMGRGYNARVALTLTIVDIETGQIISSVQSIGVVRAREAFAQGTYKGVTFGGDIFFKTPLGQATQEAIESGVSQVIREMPRNTWRPMIAAVRGGTIILNGGRSRGFREGAVYIVRAPAEPVTDPTTGDVLSFLPGSQIGSLRISRVDDTIAFAEAVQGARFERGQWLIEQTAP